MLYILKLVPDYSSGTFNQFSIPLWIHMRTYVRQCDRPQKKHHLSSILAWQTGHFESGTGRPVSWELMMPDVPLIPLITWPFTALVCTHLAVCFYISASVPKLIFPPVCQCDAFRFSVYPSQVSLTWCRADERVEPVWISGLFMNVPLDQSSFLLAPSSFLVPAQEIYCVCSSLGAHCIIGIPDTVQTDSGVMEGEEGWWNCKEGQRRRKKEKRVANIKDKDRFNYWRIS